MSYTTTNEPKEVTEMEDLKTAIETMLDRMTEEQLRILLAILIGMGIK